MFRGGILFNRIVGKASPGKDMTPASFPSDLAKEYDVFQNTLAEILAGKDGNAYDTDKGLADFRVT